MKYIYDYLLPVEDFRMEKKKCLHKFSDILFIGLLTYYGEDYEDMVLFAQSNESFLSELVELPNGIPSHDTFNCFFGF